MIKFENAFDEGFEVMSGEIRDIIDEVVKVRAPKEEAYIVDSFTSEDTGERFRSISTYV